MSQLETFLHESNHIEGICRGPSDAETEAFRRFLRCANPTAATLGDLQAVFAPGMPIRERLGMDVRVGNYIAPAGGPAIVRRLNTLLRRMRDGSDPWTTHVAFEMLHPYCDGNGRTGRMLWAWHMRALGRDPFALPFLHRFYYQTLEMQG
jgi:Fic/DOC family